MNTFETINTTVSEVFEVSVEDMVSKSREKDILFARYAAMHIAKNFTNYTLNIIGQAYGNRHYSTVISALKNADYLVETNRIWRIKVTQILILLQSKLYDT